MYYAHIVSETATATVILDGDPIITCPDSKIWRFRNINMRTSSFHERGLLFHANV